MGNIHIGNKIANKRKEKGITQEELANYLGVSKPAVSKWESGQSYPDILLLPELASYFDISIDELIGYEPQMEKGDVRKLYRRLANDFAKKPFDQVYGECLEYIKKYFSCWYLQLQMGVLMINHSMLAGDPQKTQEILKMALNIFERVAKEAQDINLAKQAIKLQATCHLMLHEPAEVINLLDGFDETLIPSGGLLVNAYLMKGNTKKALEILQGNVYISLMVTLDSCTDFFQIYANDLKKIEDCYQRFLKLGKIFEVEEMNPYVMIKIHVLAAQLFISLGEKEKALTALEAYCSLVKQVEKEEFRLKGNNFFDVLEDYFASIDAETFAPRSGKFIHNDIVNLIVANPAFESLEKEERFIRIKKKLTENTVKS